MERTTYPINYENIFHNLIGSPVLQVEYDARENNLPQTASNYQTDQSEVYMVDSVVRLYISFNTAIEIYWNTITSYFDEEFLNYGIKARLVDAQAGHGEFTRNVSGEAVWKDMIGQTITDLRLYTVKTWVESPKTGVKMDFNYPKSIAVTFSNSKVVCISTVEYSAGHRFHTVRGVTGLVVTTKETIV